MYQPCGCDIIPIHCIVFLTAEYQTGMVMCVIIHPSTTLVMSPKLWPDLAKPATVVVPYVYPLLCRGIKDQKHIVCMV